MKNMTFISSSVALGVCGSLLSALTALVVAKYSHDATDVLYLLLAQYFIGSIMNFRFGRLKVGAGYHFIRLLLGLWSFGGYFLPYLVPEVLQQK